MQNNKEVFNVDGTDYTVITQVKDKASAEGIYKILARYVLEKIDENLKNNN